MAATKNKVNKLRLPPRPRARGTVIENIEPDGVYSLVDLIATRRTTMSRLAKKAGASQSAVSLWVYGKRRPGLDNALRIAEILQVEPWQIKEFS